MSIKIFTDRSGQSVMYDDCTEIAFGPVFGEDEDPKDFLEWTKLVMLRFGYRDIRILHEHTLSNLVDAWRKEVKENKVENQGSQYVTTPVDHTCSPDDVCSSCQEDLDYAEMCADEKWRSK